MRISRYRYLRFQRIVKARWITQRRNVEEFAFRSTILKHSNLDTTDKNEDLVTYNASFFVLLASNSLLLLANILTFASLIPISGLSDMDFQNQIRVFLGLAAFFSWMNVLTIMSISSQLGVVASTLQRTFKEISYLVYGISPIFLAFLFAGFCAFHTHERFNTLLKVAASLGAILCGDEVTGFILASKSFGDLGLLYGLSFCILFMVCIHNVLIFVVGEAFKMYTVETMRKQNGLKTPKNLSRGVTTEHFTEVFGENLINLNMVEFDHKSVLSEKLNYEKQVIFDNKEADKEKIRLFQSIRPQYKEAHIREMNMRIEFIREDLFHLNESLEDMLEEKMGRMRLYRQIDQKESYRGKLVVFGFFDQANKKIIEKLR